MAAADPDLDSGRDGQAGRDVPRLLVPALLVVAAIEIPWAVYLVVSQADESKVGYLRVAAAGLAIGTWATGGAAAVGMVRRRPWAPVPAVMSATLWLGAGVNGIIAVPMGDARDFPALSIPIALALPAGVASAAVALGLLSGPLSGRVLRAVAAAALLVFPALLTFIALTAAHMPNRTRVPHGAMSWDVLDAAEIVALLVLAVALWSRHARTAIVAGSAGLMLFVGDAFYNVVLTRGEAFDESLFFLFIGELPTSVLCVLGIRSALRLIERQHAGPARVPRVAVDPPPKGHIA